MNAMVTMIVNLEKEIEMERQGQRRTRRYIGDASMVSDPRWYQNEASRMVEHEPGVDETGSAASLPRREEKPSLMERIFHQPRPRREPACNEC